MLVRYYLECCGLGEGLNQNNILDHRNVMISFAPSVRPADQVVLGIKAALDFVGIEYKSENNGLKVNPGNLVGKTKEALFDKALEWNVECIVQNSKQHGIEAAEILRRIIQAVYERAEAMDIKTVRLGFRGSGIGIGGR